MNIFDHLNNLTYKKIFPDFSLEEVHKSYDPFMVNRWLSFNEPFIPIVQLVNKKDIPKEVHYRFLFNLLPKVQVFFNYIKKKKGDELESEKRELLMKHFEFGEHDLDTMLSVLSEEQIEKILNKFKSGKVK